jgi:hypothetical protein
MSKSNMEMYAVASRPNMVLGVDASKSNMEVDAVTSRPNVVVGRARVHVQHGGERGRFHA